MHCRYALRLFFTAVLFLFAGIAFGEGVENVVSDPELGISFRTPEGWKAQRRPEGYVFSSDSLEGMIVIIPHDFEELAEMAAAAREGIVDEESGTDLQLCSLIRHFGRNGIAGEFNGVFQNRPAKAYGVGLMSPGGGGVIVLAAVDPGRYSNMYPRLVQTVASGILFIQN